MKLVPTLRVTMRLCASIPPSNRFAQSWRKVAVALCQSLPTKTFTDVQGRIIPQPPPVSLLFFSGYILPTFTPESRFTCRTAIWTSFALLCSSHASTSVIFHPTARV